MKRFLLVAVCGVMLPTWKSADAIHLTNPRTEAEYLAIEITGTIAAPAALADQIENDIAVIRGAYPFLSGIYAFPSWMPGEVLVDFNRDTFDAIKAGTYTGFDDLFADLGTPQMQLRGDHPLLTPGVFLQFDLVYHGQRLAEMFADAPGVTNAWANHTIGDGNDIVARADRTYTLSRGWGDCPAGCIYRESWSFTVTDGVDGPAVSPVPEPSSFLVTLWLVCLFHLRRQRP